MLLGSIFNPGRGPTPPPQSEPPTESTPSTPPPAAEPSPAPAPVTAESEPAPGAVPPLADGSPSPAETSPTSVAAALSANPSSRSDYRAMGSWIASGSVPPVTVMGTAAKVDGEAAQSVAPTRDAILRDAWGAVLSQAKVSRTEVIELLR